MYPLFLALRYARSRAVTYLALFTVALSVASFVVVMGVMGGFLHTVEEIILKTGSPLAIHDRTSAGMYGAEKLTAALERIPGVRGASPYVTSPSRVRAGAPYLDGPPVRGLVLERELRHSGLGEYLCRERPDKGDREASPPQSPLKTLLGELTGGASGGGRSRSAKPAITSFEVPEGIVRERIPEKLLSPWEKEGGPGTVRIWPEKEPDGGRPEPTIDDDSDEGTKPRHPVKRGKRQSADPPRGAIVGATLAKKLNLKPGQEIIITVRDPLDSDAVRAKSFYVIGFYWTRTEWLDQSVLVDLRAAQQLLGIKGAMGISIWPEDIKDLDIVRERVEEICPADRFTRVRSWRETQPDAIRQLEMQDLVMMIILLIFLVLCGAFIMAILWVLVADKTRDIGTVRALGAGRLGVVATFVSQGLAIGVLGTILGLAGGFLLAGHVNEVVCFLDGLISGEQGPRHFASIAPSLFGMSRLPVYYNPVHLISMVVTTVGVSFLASLIPAMRAACLHPVEALRHE